MKNNDKRELREEKRIIKRAGNKLMRRAAKQAILESPEIAHELEIDYGKLASSVYNGLSQLPDAGDLN